MFEVVIGIPSGLHADNQTHMCNEVRDENKEVWEFVCDQ